MTARIGVVGCGWWSTYAHLPALRAMPDAHIGGLVDPDQSRLAAAAEAFGVDATFSSADAMFDDAPLDGVVVAVPHAHHYPLTRAALERDLHVLVEKPMVLNADDAHDLVELAAARGRELIVGYPYQYNPQALAIRTLIREGRIGSLEHVTCLFASTVRELYARSPESYRRLFGYTVAAPGAMTYSEPGSGGQGHTQLTHSAALLFWLTGLTPTAVGAFTECFELDVDLADAVAVRFSSGAVGTLSSVGSVQPGQPEILRYEIFGSRGHIRFDVNEGVASIHGPGGTTEELPALAKPLRYPEPAPVTNLVGVVLRGEPNGSPGTIGQTTVELVAAMYRSAAERRMIDLEELRTWAT